MTESLEEERVEKEIVEAYLVNAMICPHCDVTLSSNGFIRWCENGHVWSED